MKKLNRWLLIMGIVMLCLIGGNIILLSEMKAAIATDSAMRAGAAEAVAAFLIVLGLSHLVGIVNLVLQFRYFKNESILRAITFVIGIFSLFFLVVDVVMLSDIGKEYLFNFDVSGEWRIVFIGHIIHGLFAVLLLIQYTLQGRRFLKNLRTEAALKDESVFLAVQQVGVVSAVLGFLCLFLLTKLGVPQAYLSGLRFLSCIVILTPYGFAAAYWFFTKRKEKPSDWYDEKQFSDLSRGAFTALIVTVLLTIILYFLVSCKIMGIDMTLWFPCYLFLTLLIFSGSILCRSRR